jgi:hypothetical protein
MQQRRVRLNLPINTRVFLEKTTSERGSSRIGNHSNTSFCSDIPQESSTPRLVTSSSYKTLSSVGKLKEMLQNTTDKLKGISGRSNTPQLPPLHFTERTDIAKLRREARILEMEK